MTKWLRGGLLSNAGPTVLSAPTAVPSTSDRVPSIAPCPTVAVTAPISGSSLLGTIYQPRKTELETDMSIPTTPEELAIAKAVVWDVTVVTKKRRP